MDDPENCGDDEWYSKADSYWRKQPSTTNGMLGGFGKITKTDVFASRRFLLDTIADYSKETQFQRALDCGAGNTINANVSCWKVMLEML